MADPKKIIQSLNQDLFDAQQKLVDANEKNKKLASENKRIKAELAECARERDFAQRQLATVKAQHSTPTIGVAGTHKDNFRQAMLQKFRMAAEAQAEQDVASR
eukprot:TRINITY_DN2052_c0_g1_i1.p2 TRINITY_DN2052_c0_g1~~TRINITY_DN2052_c0_g1_i1.p2  ORF type:complete len:103 (-),score=32.03 TRINITY_DN2052_c0_g1_i1:222-530(-)